MSDRLYAIFHVARGRAFLIKESENSLKEIKISASL